MTTPLESAAERPDVIVVDGLRYQRIDRRADRLGCHLMYDCHMFRRCKGETVRELVKDWQREHDKPGKYGPPSLCPVIVLEGKNELRRVGSMVHAMYRMDPEPEKRRARQLEALNRWIEACEQDPDIQRLLAAGRNCSDEATPEPRDG